MISRINIVSRFHTLFILMVASILSFGFMVVAGNSIASEHQVTKGEQERKATKGGQERKVTKAEADQKSINATCQAAREAKLAPLRQQRVEECVRKKEKKDRASCEQYNRDYGERSGTRAGLFYDLPECANAK